MAAKGARGHAILGLMPRLRVDLDVIRHALLGRALNQVGNSPLAVRLSEPATMGPLSIHTDADISSIVFNRADDRDPEGVFSSDSRAHIPYVRSSPRG